MVWCGKENDLVKSSNQVRLRASFYYFAVKATRTRTNRVSGGVEWSGVEERERSQRMKWDVDVVVAAAAVVKVEDAVDDNDEDDGGGGL